MPDTLKLTSTTCAIDKQHTTAEELYPANFALSDLNADIFSARRLPDQIHYRIVKCLDCGLVRSDPVLSDFDQLTALYTNSLFTYDDQVENIGKTYSHYLAKLNMPDERKDTLVEVGGGNGFFLDFALEAGYENVYNVEPSKDAVSNCPPHLSDAMICDILRPGMFPSESVDVICFFQVFDHLPDPRGILEICYDMLKPGGMILFVHHDVEAWSARLLGEKSPIIDIEHLYLYSRETMRRILELENFEVTETGSVWNTYSLSYLVRYLPLPKQLKEKVLGLTEKSSLARNIILRVPLGNLYAIARK